MDENKKKSGHMLLRFGIALFFIVSCTIITTSANKVKAAYWLEGSIPIENIDSSLFTHLLCAFATLDPATYRISVPASFSRFTTVVRKKNPSVKTLISLGGDNGDSSAQAFSSMASSPASRKVFIDSTIQVARAKSFDGLDIAYDVPGNKVDMSNLGTLLSEWRTAVNTELKSSNKPALLLTAAVRYTTTNYSPTKDPYPTSSIATNLDWINIIACSFITSQSWGSPNKTGPTASLLGPVSGSSGVHDWIRAGVPPTKIVLEIPFFGYAWTLANSSNHGYGAPATGPAITPHGPVGYKEIKDGDYCRQGNKVYDSITVGNYCYKGTTWISFDDVEAIFAKVKYVSQNGLLGYFAWHVGLDDDAFTLSTTASNTFSNSFISDPYIYMLCF